MLKKVEIEAKTQKEAMDLAIEQLNVSEDKIKLELIKEKKGLLGIGSINTYEATIDVNLLQEGKAYINSILTGLGTDFRMEARALNDNTEIYYDIDTNENSLLIGKEGRCLEAFQTLVKNYLSNYSMDKLIVSVDIGGYKANRTRQLEILATKVAKEVARTKIAVKLDPMTSFERRVIHSKLGEWRDVYTESEGEGENRCLVIKPKK